MQSISNGPVRSRAPIKTSEQPPQGRPVRVPQTTDGVENPLKTGAAKAVRAVANPAPVLPGSRPHGVTCLPDGALTSRGWQVSSKNFPGTAKEVRARFEAARKHFVPDTEGVVYSSVARRLVRITSFDDLRTPQSEMFGDVAFFTDALTGEPIETRWYADAKKHTAYDTGETPCATNVIPMAENALF